MLTLAKAKRKRDADILKVEQNYVLEVAYEVRKAQANIL